MMHEVAVWEMKENMRLPFKYTRSNEIRLANTKPEGFNPVGYNASWNKEGLKVALVFDGSKESVDNDRENAFWIFDRDGWDDVVKMSVEGDLPDFTVYRSEYLREGDLIVGRIFEIPKGCTGITIGGKTVPVC